MGPGEGLVEGNRELWRKWLASDIEKLRGKEIAGGNWARLD